MDNLKEDLSNIEKGILLIIKAVPEGKYEKSGDNYQFEFGEGNKFIVLITNENIEFRLPVTKWIKGSYEFIETSELFKSACYKELETLSEEESLEKIKLIINEVKLIIN